MSGSAGFRPQRGPVGVERLFRLTAVAQGVTEDLMGLGAVRARAQHQPRGLGSLLRAVQGEQRVGAGQLEIGGRLQADRLVQQCFGDRRPPGLQGQRTEGMQRLRMPRHRRDHLPVDLFGLRQPAGHMKLLPLPEEGVDLLRPFAHAVGSSAGRWERAMMGFWPGRGT